MPDPKPPKESLSKTPSWIMLGFIVGCIVALTVKRDWEARERASQPLEKLPSMAPPSAQISAAPSPKPPVTRLSLSDMEAIFEKWQSRAIWRHELTEVAYWNPTTNQFSELVEVLRSGEDLYFRSIPKLTRPLVTEGIDPTVPIRFTELEETRAARRAPFIIPPH